MPSQPHKTPKESKAPHKKSRLGCTRCKALRTKCDEKRPSCSRCEARGVPCSGYSVNIRWSYKHEVQQQRGSDEEPEPATTTADNGHHNITSTTGPDPSSVNIPLRFDDPSNSIYWDSLSAAPSFWHHDLPNRQPPQQRGSPEEHGPASGLNSDGLNMMPGPEPGHIDNDMSTFHAVQGTHDASNGMFPDNDSLASVFEQWGLSNHPRPPSSGHRLNYFDFDLDSALQTLPPHGAEHGSSSLSLLSPLARVEELDGVEDMSEMPVPPAQTSVVGKRSRENDFGDDQQLSLDGPNPGRVRHVRDVSSSLATYFFQDVLGRYCTWDSDMNVMRIIIDAMWQSSGAMYHTIQSMAASCLSNEIPHFSKIAEQERVLALQTVQDTSMREDRLMAAFLLGHTSCWVNPTDLVPNQFNELWMALASNNSSATTTLTVSFIQEALEYWTMMLAFITDTEHLRESAAAPARPFSHNSPITANPFSGISREAVSIFTDTGRLSYKLRKRIPQSRFVRGADLSFFQNALKEADQLERRILSYIPLDASRFVVLGDPQTTPEHFQILDEAFRYTSLLQLYRLFPDLLVRRYRPWNPQEVLRPQLASKMPNQADMDEWLTKLALHILNMLQGIPVESRTRSIQSPILVAVSSELRFTSFTDTSAPGGVSDSRDASAMSVPAINHSIDIARARRFVMLRLSMYWHVLPLLKIKKYQALVKEVWEALDAGVPDVYWADMLCDERLRTIMG